MKPVRFAATAARVASRLSSFARVRAARRAAGVGLVTAIFLLVALAALGVAIVSVTTAQHASATQDQQGVRAYQAARAGIEWGLWRALRGAGTPSANLACPNAAGVTFAFPAGTTLSAFSVTVTCTAPRTAIAGAPEHFLIRATACNEPGPAGCPNASKSVDYAQRVLEVQL